LEVRKQGSQEVRKSGREEERKAGRCWRDRRVVGPAGRTFKLSLSFIRFSFNKT